MAALSFSIYNLAKKRLAELVRAGDAVLRVELHSTPPIEEPPTASPAEFAVETGYWNELSGAMHPPQAVTAVWTSLAFDDDLLSSATVGWGRPTVEKSSDGESVTIDGVTYFRPSTPKEPEPDAANGRRRAIDLDGKLVLP